MKQPLEELLDKDYHYSTEYEYDTDTNCEEYGCHEEGICRCSTIEDFRITEIHVDSIAKDFCKLSTDEFTQYCIYRALIACRIWDVEKWEYHIEHSYYGEEIDYIKLGEEIKLEIYNTISKVLRAKSNKEKLFVVLDLEYGYILPDLKKFDNFEIELVDYKKIHVGSSIHYKKLNKQIIKMYKDYDLPIGLCIEKDKGFKLIDGYHRYAAKKDTNKIGVKIIVARK